MGEAHAAAARGLTTTPQLEEQQGPALPAPAAVHPSQKPEVGTTSGLDQQPQEPPQQPPVRGAPPEFGCTELPWAAKTESCLRTFDPAQSGQATASPFRTSSSKCASHCMQTYS